MGKIIFAGIILLGLILAACNQQAGSNATNVTSPTEGAIGVPNTPANTPGNGTLRQCTQTIPYQTLIQALPGKVGSLSTQSPEGTTLTWTDPTNSQNTVKYSTASAVLTGNNTSVIISLLDTCYVQYLSAGWSTRAAFNGTQGFMQQTTVSGYPAWEQYDRESNTYAMNVLVRDRVLVTVQGTEGSSEQQVREVAEAVDYNKIANAATT